MASNILPLFWNLASSSKDARLGASVELISTLEGFQQNHAAESGDEDDEDDEDTLARDNAEDVAYSVKRLIRGLASSRESSRFGFAVALTELLHRVETISPAQTLALILRHSQTSKGMKGSDERDGLFARLFGLTAIVQSGALFRGDIEVFGQVMDALVELGRKKLYLRESAWWAICQACDLLLASGVEWEQAGLDKLASLLQGAWNQDKLALALRLETKIKLDHSPFKPGPILSNQNLPFLARILRDAEDESTWKPQLHHVWTQIFTRVSSFVDFFRVVVDESLFANNASVQKRYWGFQVFITALPQVPADDMPQLFTPNFMRCWINNLSKGDRYLHKAAQSAAAVVQDVVKANPRVGFTLLDRLIGKHGRVDFDKATKTKTVEGILGNMSVDGVREYAAYLKKAAAGDDATTRRWAIEQLSSLIRNQRVPKTDDWVADALDFMLVHGLFVSKLSIAATARERYFAALLDLSTVPPSRETNTRRQQGCNDAGELYLRRALDRVVELEKTLEPVAEADDEIVSMRKQAIKLLGRVKGGTEMAKACEILLCYAVLQTYDEKPDMLETLEDVSTAVEKIIAKKRGEDEPEPVDLLLDTLIALLDKGSVGLRSLANMVLGLVAPALTQSSIEHLVAQLESAPQPIEGPEIDAEELEDDDDESDESDSSSEAGSAESEEEEMGDVDPAFRKRVEEALKLAGMDPEGTGEPDASDDDDDESDGSESEDSVWDDEQMLKVDEQLAKVFKERKEGNTKAKAKKMLTENVHFKTRILDLFDTFIRKQPSSPLILETVLPLLGLVRRTGDEAILATRTAGIIRSRFDKPREVPEVNVTRAKAILDEIHTFARRVSSNEVSGAASSCSLYVARCIHSTDSTSSAVNDVYKATINDWMTRNASAVRVPFLTEYIKRFAVQAWPLRSDLVRYLDNDDTHPYRQTQIYDILAIFCSYLGTITPAVGTDGADGVEAFVVDARGKVVDTLRHAAATGGTEGKRGWKANWLKEVLKFALHLARVSKAALGRERALGVWDVVDLERLLGEVQVGEKTRDMKGVHALIKQLRAVVEAEQSKKRKQGQGE